MAGVFRSLLPAMWAGIGFILVYWLWTQLKQLFLFTLSISLRVRQAHSLVSVPPLLPRTYTRMHRVLCARPGGDWRQCAR